MSQQIDKALAEQRCADEINAAAEAERRRNAALKQFGKPYLVYVCGDKDYQEGVVVQHFDAKSACEKIAFDRTGIERVTFLGTVTGCSQQDIYVYEDEHHWIYNVVKK